MKKLILLSLIGLCLCACNKNESSNKVVDKPKYDSVSIYHNVYYSFDGYMRCCVHYIKYKGSDESGYEITYEKDWCVYLTGYYYIQYIDSYSNAFYECKLNNTNKYDYYLLYRGN